MKTRGCLVVHGLSGTPKNLESITKVLQEKGYLVSAPLLAGHDKDLNALLKTTWPEWYASLLAAYNDLKGKVDEVYFVGLSMGALIGMKLASELGNSLKGVALLAPPFKIRPLFRYIVIPGVRYTPLRWIIRSVAKNFDKSVCDPKGRQLYKEYSFPRMPSRGVFECQDLARLLKKELGKIRQPLLVIQGKKDHLVDPTSVDEIKQGVASKNIQTLFLENSAHVLTVDCEKEAVAKKITDFFDRTASSE